MSKEDQDSESLSGKRSYDNTRREARARQTRERIIEGVVEACLDESVDDLSMAIAAERSGVSVATIYRYFPDRESLLEAVDRRIGEKLGRPKLPESIEVMAENAPSMAQFYEQYFDLMKLARTTANKLDKDSRGMRDRLIVRLLKEETAHLSEEEARGVQSIFRFFFSFDLYMLQRERFGVSPDSAGKATQWAIRTLLNELRAQRPGQQEEEQLTETESPSTSKGERA